VDAEDPDARGHVSECREFDGPPKINGKQFQKQEEGYGKDRFIGVPPELQPKLHFLIVIINKYLIIN
jgi:hypothetical protein